MAKYEKVIFIGDSHAPYEDNDCISSLLKFIRWFKPDKIFFLGDIVDFYAISRFIRDPKKRLELQEEIDVGIDLIVKIKKVCPKKSELLFIRGNHEYRLQKFIWATSPELSGLRSLNFRELMMFDKLGIKYIEQGRMEYRGIVVKHGSVVRKYSGYSARAEFEKTGRSGVSGHTHRGAIYCENKSGGEYKWMECGCLCKLDPEYMEGETPNWSQGWGIGYFKNNSKRFHLEFVPYVNGKAMYSGKEFSK